VKAPARPLAPDGTSTQSRLRLIGQGMTETRIDAWVADLRTEDPFSTPARYYCALTEDEIRRGACYRAWLPKRRFLSSRLIVRTLLGSRLGERPAALRIACTASGKPFLPDHPGLQVNWSRSDDLLLVGIAENDPIGVDIERVRVVASAAQVLATIYPRLHPADVAADPLVFFSAWTMLEAAVKATGRGLAGGARDVALALTPDGRCTLEAITNAGDAAWYGHTDLLDSSVLRYTAVAAFVARGAPVSVRLRHWPEDPLLTASP
jgi:4'-phosphopantetheinyl transferase